MESFIIFQITKNTGTRFINMKAKFVYENLDFERGKDPMDAMFGTKRQRTLIERALKDFGKKYKARESQFHEGIEGEIVGMVSGLKGHPYTVFKIQWFPEETNTYPGMEFAPRTYIGEVYRYQSWRKTHDPEPSMTGSKDIMSIIDFFEKERSRFQVGGRKIQVKKPPKTKER